MPHPEQKSEAIAVEKVQHIADTIDRWGLRNPVSLMLDILKPIDFMSSQAALFVRPLLPSKRWEEAALALTNEHAWAELRGQLSEKQEQEK